MGGCEAPPAANTPKVSVSHPARPISTSPALPLDFEIDRKRFGVGGVAQFDRLLLTLHHAVAAFKGYRKFQRLRFREDTGLHLKVDALLDFVLAARSRGGRPPFVLLRTPGRLCVLASR